MSVNSSEKLTQFELCSLIRRSVDEKANSFINFLLSRSPDLAIEYVLSNAICESPGKIQLRGKVTLSCNGYVVYDNKDKLLILTGSGYLLYNKWPADFYDLSVKELTEALMENPGKTIEYTYDKSEALVEMEEEPSDWYCIQYVKAFNCIDGTFICGPYGGQSHFAVVFDSASGDVTAEEAVQKCLNAFCDSVRFIATTVCTDLGIETI